MVLDKDTVTMEHNRTLLESHTIHETVLLLIALNQFQNTAQSQ